MIINNIKAHSIDTSIAVATDIVEIEFSNEENNTQFACLVREYDGVLSCILDDAAIYDESIFDIAVEGFNKPEIIDEYFEIREETALESYGVYRKGLPMADMKSSKYERIILFAEMTCDNIKNIDEFAKEYVGKDLDDIEIDAPYWMDDLEGVIAHIEKQQYTDDLGNKDDEFIKKFEDYKEEAVESIESESDEEERLEMATFFDQSLNSIEEYGMQALDEAIVKFKNKDF